MIPPKEEKETGDPQSDWDWPRVWRHFNLTMGIIAITVVAHFGTSWRAASVAEGWLSSAIHEDKTELPKSDSLTCFSIEMKECTKGRLKEQYEDVRNHSISQMKVYLGMQRSYYAWTVIWSALAGLAAILGIFVVQKGWTNSNHYLLNAALTVTLLMTFWQAIPKVLSMPANIGSAKKSYLACLQLGNEIRSFAEAPQTPTPPKTITDLELAFIANADKRLSEIRNLNFDIDPAQAPDYRKSIQEEINKK